MKFRVIREMWHRGRGGYRSALLTTQGTRCCLGFLAAECGIPDQAMLSRGSFHDLCVREYPESDREIDREVAERLPTSLIGLDEFNVMNTDLTNRIIDANDTERDDAFSYGGEPETREQRLTRLFAEGGIEVEFV